MSMLEDVQKFITCIRCKQVPSHPPLYSCKEGHIICEYCFLESTIGGNKTNICPQCGNRIYSRNIFGEELLKSYSQSSMNHIDLDKKTRTKNSCKNGQNTRFPPISASKNNSSISLHVSPSFINTSRRPIYCPNTDCHKMIAITQLISHFQFDHSRIPMESLEFNQPKSLILSLNSMKYGKSHCVGLLLISSEKDSFSIGISQKLNDDRIGFPLLAAKLRCKPDETSFELLNTPQNTPRSSRNSTRNEDAYTPPVSPRNLPRICEELNHSDIVIIWICGNVDTNIKCLIEVSDENQTRIYSYFGSVNSLRDSNDPMSVFQRADCLLLHSSSVQRITSNGKYPMDLKVLINCPYDSLL